MNRITKSSNLQILSVILTWVFLLLFTGCSPGQNQISGKVESDLSDIKEMIYLIDPMDFGKLVSSYEGKTIDSAQISSDGSFGFKSLPDTGEEKMYLLAIQKKDSKFSNKLENLNPADANYIPFVYRPGTSIQIHSNTDYFLNNAEIIGGPETNKDIMKLAAKRSKLHKELLAELGEVDEDNLMEYEKAILDFQIGLVHSVSDDKDLFVQALALRWAATDSEYERIPELVKSVCKKMNESDPNHPWTMEVCQKTETLPLTAGDIFPDYELPMSDDTTAGLKSLLGSKLTIIDLWASWCGPCRIENRTTLVPLWEEYHDKGFQIVGYALDASKNVWLKAIEKDGAQRWPHASHLGGDESPFLDRLRVSVIPANYIVDEKGVILAKNLHGEDLVKFVEEYFQ